MKRSEGEVCFAGPGKAALIYHFLPCSHAKTAEGGTGSPASPLSEVIEPDVVRWGREEHWDIQYTKSLLREQWTEQLHTAILTTDFI